jgi:aryl-alcohol dehydrogenase-like predicted oxidoreductase
MTGSSRIPFGRTGMDITRVGFGAWAVGGSWRWGWGAQDDDESIAAIRRAVELGVNWVDTAPVYGWGHSEDVVRRALEPFSEPDRPYVFTKTGPHRLEDGESYMRGDAATLRQETEASLRRLGVERLDLLQVHWPPDDSTAIEDYWTTLVALREEGKVAHIGLSNHDVTQLDQAEAIEHVETLQPPFSAIERGAAADVIPWCASHETGVIVYSPMQAGLLTGSFTRARLSTLDESDWRRSDDEFTVNLDRNLALADALRPVAAKHATTVAATAIAWTLAWPGVTAAIVGARRPEQVDGWIPAAELVLDVEDLDTIAAAISTTEAGTGPLRP